MLSIQNVSKKFEKTKVLDDINIEVKAGTIHGIIGENGVGKTTLLQMMVGIYTVEEGRILVDGQSVYDNNLVKQSIGYVADRNQYFNHYKVKDMVKFYTNTYSTFSKDKFARYNKSFKLPLNKKISQLSKGMQMRLAFMLNMAINPKFIVLDEPTSGLDVIAKKMLFDFLIEAVEREGLTVVISSHHLTEIEKICDDVTILRQGKVAYQSTLEGLKTQVKKLQVVFEEGKVPDFSTWKEFVNVDKIGSVYYLVTTMYSKELEDKLKACGVLLMEEIGINLEEIFIYTNTSREEMADEA